MLLIGIGLARFAVIGGVGIVILMVAAIVTHLRVKNPVFKMLPASALMICAATIAWVNYRIMTG